MFPLSDQLELRKVTISSLVSCIYLPIIITVVSYKDLLYTVGNASSIYILALIFIAELLKSFYLNSNNDTTVKRKANKNRVSEIVRSAGFLLGVTALFFIGIILFGAPFLEAHEETLMLASLMTLLTMFPLVAHTGVETSIQLLFRLKKYSNDTIVSSLISNVVMTIFGAWVGAVVIPLDWNTPWQKWPIPCYLGALAGYLLSNVNNVIYAPLMSTIDKYPALNYIFCFSKKLDIFM